MQDPRPSYPVESAGVRAKSIDTAYAGLWSLLRTVLKRRLAGVSRLSTLAVLAPCTIVKLLQSAALGVSQGRVARLAPP